MSWGTATIGGFAFRETVTANEENGVVTLTGQDSAPPQTRAAVRAAHRNVRGLRGQYVAATFSDKSELDGFYLVTSASSALTNEQGGQVVSATWTLQLALVGKSSDVEIESRAPALGRVTDLAGPPAPVFWHAPAVGTDTYYTGATVPGGTVSRLSAEGIVKVYTGLPATFPPRWTVDASEYEYGSAKVLLDLIRSLGENTPDQAVWQIDNGLLRVRPAASGGIEVSAYDPEAADWKSVKSHQFTVNGAALTTTPEFTVLRNGCEEVCVRLTYDQAPGRVTVDLSLRRGSRFVAGTMKRHSAATLGVTRTAAEASTAITGGLRATAADADGNRAVMGSAKTATTTTATPSLAKAAVLLFDFFLGHEIGAAPQAGDAFADLLGQYLGSTGRERVRVVRR
jgi:hypothetical protein